MSETNFSLTTPSTSMLHNIFFFSCSNYVIKWGLVNQILKICWLNLVWHLVHVIFDPCWTFRPFLKICLNFYKYLYYLFKTDCLLYNSLCTSLDVCFSFSCSLQFIFNDQSLRIHYLNFTLTYSKNYEHVWVAYCKTKTNNFSALRKLLCIPWI